MFYLAGDRGYTTIFKTSASGGRVSRFSLYALDDQLAGGFDLGESKFRTESGSPLAVAQPFQITSFSFAQRSQTITRSGGAEVAFPMALTLGTVLRPAEVWFGIGGLVAMERLRAPHDSLVLSVGRAPA